MQLFQKRDALTRTGSSLNNKDAVEMEKNSVGWALSQLMSAVGCGPVTTGDRADETAWRGASGAARSAVLFHGGGGGSPLRPGRGGGGCCVDAAQAFGPSSA
jgi:hypothetical protein